MDCSGCVRPSDVKTSMTRGSGCVLGAAMNVPAEDLAKSSLRSREANPVGDFPDSLGATRVGGHVTMELEAYAPSLNRT